MALKHSGLGIASFVISLVAGVAEFLLSMVAGYIEMSTPGGINADDPIAGIIGLMMIAGIFGALVGVGLGIAVLFQKDRKKVFCILGLIFNSVILIALGGLMVLGMSS